MKTVGEKRHIQFRELANKFDLSLSQTLQKRGGGYNTHTEILVH